jgi:hypothetical protein
MKKQKWNIEDLATAVAHSSSIRMVILKLGLVPAGGNYDRISGLIRQNKLPISHFKGQGWAKGINTNNRKAIPLSDVLVENSNYQSFKLKKRLYAENSKPVECEECGWNKMSQDGRIPLELDHINGIRSDNRLENLRILCPNCHSLKPTHRGKNKLGWRNGRRPTLKMS